MSAAVVPTAKRWCAGGGSWAARRDALRTVAGGRPANGVVGGVEAAMLVGIGEPGTGEPGTADPGTG